MSHETTWLRVSAIVAILAASASAYYAHDALKTSRSRLSANELQPIATLLQENQALIQELKAEPFAERDSGILESYLAKVRRDGVAKHADMKQKLDTLSENNTAIVTLIKAYAPQANTRDFRVESDKFRNYASAWNDRWNSVMEIFMAGGNYAVSEVPLPPGFLEAVQAEITASR